jgi:arylsulfatase A-like enzyme
VFPWIGKPGYNLTTDLADDAIEHMRELNASAPDKPFFVYYVPGGTHSPHQPTREWIDKFKGKFDMGYEKLREQIFANQKRLGVIPPDTQLTPWPDGQPAYAGAKLPRWDSLSLAQKKLYEREAEVFAGYAAYTDHEIGRVIQEVQDEGKLDDTLIIYICGDNGTSAEGTLYGTFNQLTAYNGILDAPMPLQLLHYSDWGSDKTYPHMAVQWAWAFDTPFKWTKQVASHFGGTRQGLAILWPGHITDVGGIRTQFHHVIDIVPTILEAAGIKAPETVNGIKQKPIEGVSMAYTFDKAKCQCTVEARDAVFRTGRQPRNLPRRLDGKYDSTHAGVGSGNGQAARPCHRLPMGALPHRRRLLAIQRLGREDARQAERNAVAVCDRGGEIQCLPLG